MLNASTLLWNTLQSLLFCLFVWIDPDYVDTGWPGTLYIVQACLKYKYSLAYVSCLWGLKA